MKFYKASVYIAHRGGHETHTKDIATDKSYDKQLCTDVSAGEFMFTVSNPLYNGIAEWANEIIPSNADEVLFSLEIKEFDVII